MESYGSGSRQESGRKLLDGLTAAQKLQMLPMVMPLFAQRADGFQVPFVLQRFASHAFQPFNFELMYLAAACSLVRTSDRVAERRSSEGE